MAIEDVRDRLRVADDEPTRRSWWRLDEAAASARRVGTDLEDTAGDLARIRGRGTCPADWGCCPEHGNTLRSTAGQSSCIVSGCGRSWGYDRAGTPCPEQVAFTVRDPHRGSSEMCAGHAMDAQTRIIGATVTPL